MNQESEQDLPPQQEYGGGSDSLPVPLLNAGGFTVLQLPQTTSSAIADPAIKPPFRKCSSCGFGTSAKKRSQPPSSPFSSPLCQPCSKRPAISSTNLSSPDPTPPSSSERKMQWSPLHRSLSDSPIGFGIGGAYYYQDFPNPAAAAAASSLKKNPLSPPGNFKISPIPLLDSQESFPMTTMVPGQHRSPSNPSSSSEYCEQAVNTTPPRPRQPACVRPQMFHHDHGSPNSKKLKRELKGKFEELMQLMDHADCEQQQDDDDDDAADDININCIDKAQQEKGEMMNQNEKCKGGHNDSVWVKQTEEGGLILHFKCSCGDAYEVFLHEDKCYYRLA